MVTPCFLPTRSTLFFLEVFGEGEEPPTAGEADVAGPWRVEPVRRAFGLFRAGESPERGHRPTAVFSSRFLALLAAAVLPGVGRDPAFRLRKQPDFEGYGLESRADWSAVVGHLELFDERFVDALNVVFGLAAAPTSLAQVLEAVGAVALDRAGAVLAEQVAAPPREPKP